MRFSLGTTVSTPQLASFWQEKHDMAIILVKRFANNHVVMSKQVKNTVAILSFFEQQKGAVTSNKNK